MFRLSDSHNVYLKSLRLISSPLFFCRVLVVFGCVSSRMLESSDLTFTQPTCRFVFHHLHAKLCTVYSSTDAEKVRKFGNTAAAVFNKMSSDKEVDGKLSPLCHFFFPRPLMHAVCRCSVFTKNKSCDSSQQQRIDSLFFTTSPSKRNFPESFFFFF